MDEVTEITFILRGTYTMQHCASASAIVTNLSRKKNPGDNNKQDESKPENPFRVLYAPVASSAQLNEFKKGLDKYKERKDCCIGVVNLYSDKNFDEFVKQYNERFGDTSEWCECVKNCSTAVNFVLDYFFPEACAETLLFRSYQLLCCTPGLLTCGIFYFLSCPPCVDTPQEIFKKAQLLSCRYGTAPSSESKSEDSVPNTSISLAR